MSARKPNLIEPEGVNAGSADSTAEGEVPHGDVRGGGEPDCAEEQAGRTEEDQIVDQPFMPRDPNAPSLHQGWKDAEPDTGA